MRSLYFKGGEEKEVFESVNTTSNAVSILPNQSPVPLPRFWALSDAESTLHLIVERFHPATILLCTSM